MKVILSFCIFMVFFRLNTNAQVYQFTSDREGKAKGHSSDIQFEDKNILVTIDLNSKKITLVTGRTMVFSIISTDCTLLDKEGGKLIKFRCIDNDGAKHVIVFNHYSDSVQGILGVAGTLAVSLGSETYGYELLKK